MTVFVWRVLCILSAALFAAFAVILICAKFLKNVYYHNFEEDELIKNEQTGNSYNSIYFTSGETRKYIKKYVICKTLYDKFLVCNFARRFKNITYYVMQYSRGKRPVSVLKIDQYSTSGDSSKIITLSRRCAYVNVVVGTVDDKVINTDVIRPLAVAKIRLYSLVKSLMLFCGLFAVRHAIVEIIAGESFSKQYFDNLLNYVAIAAAFVLGVLAYFVSVKCFRGKNVKEQSGGAIEYDFL
ncbi:hypothetical protein [Pumilibacter intestinalis]|uniref:hypothetical protein n=1 Tax=Pumilibacter intestinalis TaxID=2941511 RepID=UPI002041FFD8|nr:hypothetical protein [Pumilibacter intestinalis]MCI8488473.1 hypothetical protein [Clostridia bacterium]